MVRELIGLLLCMPHNTPLWQDELCGRRYRFVVWYCFVGLYCSSNRVVIPTIHQFEPLLVVCCFQAYLYTAPSM